MSDSETYFSESEDDIVNTQNTPDDPEESYESGEDEIDELDEETKNILQKHYLKNKDKEDKFFKDINISPLSSKPKKKNKEQKKKSTSLGEFYKETEKKLEDSKPKKWKSKRFLDKKDQLGISNKKKYTRAFNPRLPIPSYLTFKKKEVYNKNLGEESFPKLGVNV